MKKKLIGLLMVLALFLAACGGGGDEAPEQSGGDDNAADEAENQEEEEQQPAESTGDKKIIRVSNGINDKHPAYEASLMFKDLVEEATDDIEVQVYHSGQIADDRAAIEMLQFGSLEIVVTSTSPMANFIPAYGVFDLPFTIPNEEVADGLLDGPFGDRMFDLLAEQNLVGVAWWENGFRQVTNSKRPIASVEDFDGLKIRTMENEIHLDAWKALGANPTPMAFPELFSAMQQGTVDGQENPYPTIHLSQFAEVQDYVSNSNHVYTPFVMLFSKSIWDELTPEQQEIIKDAGVEAGKWNRDRNREVAEESLEALKETMEFTDITPEEHERLADAVAPVIEKHASTIGEDVVEEYLAEIDKLK